MPSDHRQQHSQVWIAALVSSPFVSRAGSGALRQTGFWDRSTGGVEIAIGMGAGMGMGMGFGITCQTLLLVGVFSIASLYTSRAFPASPAACIPKKGGGQL